MANPYFNATYYLANNPDLFAAGVTVATAWDHYVSYGAQEAYNAGGMTRAPNAWFDAQFYLLNNQDLIANGVTPETAFDHFTSFGMYELRAPSQSVAASPMTDASLLAYVNANADVAAALGVTVPATALTEAEQNGAIANFYGYGYAENRPAAPTDVNANPTATFTLTAGIDTATANKFVAAPETNALGQINQTLNSGDNLTASGEDSQLDVTWTAAATTVVPTLKGIETLNVSNFGTGALTITGANVTGLNNVNVNSSVFGLALNNLQSKVANVGVNNTASATSVQVANAALSGAQDEVAVTLNGALAGSSLALNAVSGTNGYETIKVASNGSANVIDTITSNTTSTKTVEISGDQNLTIRGNGAAPLSAQTTTIDASALTGKFTLGGVSTTSGAFAAAATTKGSVKVTGGEADDAFYISDLDETYVINGGAGKNALHLTAAAGAITDATVGTTAAAISNIQVLRAVQGDGDGLAANLTVNLLGTTGITELQLAKDATTTGVITLNNLTHTDGFTINAVGNKAEGAQNFNGVTYSALGLTGTSDKVAITVGNQGQAVGTGLVTLGTQTLANVENVSLALSDMSSTSTFSTTITAANLQNFEFTANAGKAAAGSFTLAGTTGGANTVKTVKIVSDGGVTATFDNAIGASIELSGAGKHNITANNTANTNSVTINASATTGGVTITSEGGADTLVGGSGNDIITGGAGADVMTGGTGADTFAYGALATVSGQTGSTLATADVITDFVSGTDFIKTGTAGSATNYAEAVAAADFATALANANTAMDTTVVYYMTSTAADGGLLFVDSNADGTADALIKLTGVDSASFAFGDIIA